MKRVISIAICFLILFSCVLPARASGGVPQEVMEATKSVVRILSEYKKGASTGSGFVIKNDGEEVLVATNNHVVEDNPQRISVWVGENRQVDAQIVFTTSAKDLCVLRLTEFVDMEPLTLSEEEAQHGAAIYAVGYPGVADILSDTEAHTSESATITDGIISAIRTFTIEEGAKPVKLLQINAAINPGNSGGPLFNTKGEVIGVNTYGIKGESQGVFGSVDISELWNLLEEHNIDIVEETLPTEVPETTEPVPVEEPESATAFLLVLIGSGAVVLILLVVFITGRRKKKSAKAPVEQKPQTTTLRDYMAAYTQGLGITGAVSLLLPVAVQLRNLHNDGKLHLQVCPENILVGTGGTSLSEPTQQETGRYNSGFAAPEIYKGAGFGITSDIYSFAAVLLYAVTGKVPGNSLQSDVLEQDFSLLEDATFAVLIRRAMASNLLERTQSMQELIYGIAVYNASVQEKPQPAKTVMPAEIIQSSPKADVIASQSAERHSKPQKKRKTKILPITAVLVCGIVTVVLLWKPAEKQEETAQLQSTEQAETTVSMTLEEAAYAEAETLLADGEIAKAAIAFGKLGDYSDARQRSFALWDETVERKTIFADNGHLGYGTFTYFGVKADGTIEGYHFGGNLPIWEEVYGWTDIVDLSYRDQGMILGLKEDGTVLSAGYDNYYGELDVSGWTDIVEVCAEGYSEPNVEYEKNSEGEWITIGNDKYYSVGLKSDGTVVATGNNQFGQCEVSDWTDIIAITTYTYREESYLKYRRGGLRDVYSYSRTFGIRADGTVVMTGKDLDNWCDLSGWTDIIAISVSDCHVVGLKSDGTVVTVGYDPSIGDIDSDRLNVSEWENVKEIHTNSYSTSAITVDGTFLFAGNWGRHDFGGRNAERTEWTSIISVQSADNITLGLKSDGTVVCWGGNPNIRDSASQWKNIVSVCCSQSLALGLKSDGTVVSASYQDSPTWRGIALPGQRKLKAPETKTGEAPTDMQAQYDAAEKLLANGETAKAAIAFGKLGDYSDARERSFAAWNKVPNRKTISFGMWNQGTENIEMFHALRKDGTIAVDCRYSETLSDEEIAQYMPSTYKNIVSIHGAIGLRYDGTLSLPGSDFHYYQDLMEWSDLVAISVPYNPYDEFFVGLKSDGTVVAVGNNKYGECNVTEWKDIIAIAAGEDCTFGLKSDGTVVATGRNLHGMCEVESWTDIKAISTHDVQTFGLRNDGTVVAIGSNYNGAITRASKLTDIAFIEGMYAFKEDGTSDTFSEEKWNNIVSITYSTEMGGMDIVGLRNDGSFVFSRGNDNSYVRAKAWNDIQLPIISETPITMPVDNASAY